MAHYAQSYVLFAFLEVLIALKEGNTGFEKVDNWLTSKHEPSSGKILNL